MDSKFITDLLPEFDEYLLDIHTAASIGCEERVRDIIENSEKKCVVDEQNKKGWTPLMYAACCVNLKVVLLLLEEEAETDIKNNEGHTALMLASKCGSSDVVNLLIDSGAKINNKDLRGWTALFHAAAFGHRSVVQLLIERGAIIDTMEDEGITPLMLAAAAGHEMIIRDLLQLGANINLETICGDTAKSLAMRNGHMNVKSIIDAHLYSKKKGPVTNMKSFPDLFSLLKDLQLTKYYHIFENHEIDLSTFWLLSDDDLQEIGIQLLGPRRKIGRVISQYQQEHCLNGHSKDTVNVDNVLMENKKLHQLVEKLKSAELHEKSLRAAAERNLNDGIQNLKNCRDAVQYYIGHAINLLERHKENHEYLRNMLTSALQDMNFKSNVEESKMELIFQSLDCMRKLIEIQHQNITSLQNRID